MPQYNLAAPEERVIVSWLFEPVGYLDQAVNVGGVSARQALQATPNLDVTNWIRGNTKALGTAQSDWEECGMVWWIWKHDSVNVTPPSRPPETVLWVSRLQEWKSSIDAALAEDPGGARRNASDVPITNEDGTSGGVIQGGAHIAHQLALINKVLGVIQ